jgi:N-methylhydantoinase A
VERYLKSIIKRFKRIGLNAPIQIMHSAGGVMTVEAAVRKPAYLVESGPAAGVIACARFAHTAGYDNVISFDMGGTTAKTGIIENGQPAKTTEYEVGAGINISSKLVKGGGYPIKLPFIDLSEIGAGGGSIVCIDSSGRITVGPKSAGANPGPICYDLGGVEPTFTDAVLTLGYINPNYLADGEVKLNAAKAKEEFDRQVARPLGMSSIDAAFGVFTLGCATMIRAVKAVSTYRGRDPRDYVLVAFGGNGPVVSAEIAQSLGIGRVLIPPAPGVFSALGLLYSDVEYEFIQTLFLKDYQVTSTILENAYNRLEEKAHANMKADGYPIDRISINRFADLRYSGQAYELTIQVSEGQPKFEHMIRDFGREHELTYDHKSDRDPVDLVNIKVVASYFSEQNRKANLSPMKYLPKEKEVNRLAYFGPDSGLLTTPVINRIDLSESPLTGPVIIEESDATCVVPPGCLVNLDSVGNIIIILEKD